MVFTKQSGLVRREDPRLGELVRAIGTKSLDVRDLANCVPARQPDGSVGAEILKRIRELEGRVDKLSSLPLEKELLDVLGGGRDAEIAARYYGFDGLGAKSLRVVGREVGLTYERVRQIASAAAKRIGSGRPFAPALDRTLDFVTAQTPAVAAEIETKLRSEGLTSGPFRIEGILKAAELLGREPPFSVVDLRGQRVVLARGGGGGRSGGGGRGVVRIREVLAQPLRVGRREYLRDCRGRPRRASWRQECSCRFIGLRTRLPLAGSGGRLVLVLGHPQEPDSEPDSQRFLFVCELRSKVSQTELRTSRETKECRDFRPPGVRCWNCAARRPA